MGAPASRLCWLAAAFLLAGGGAAWPAEPRVAPRAFDGPVRARVERVIDGDTIEATAFIWLGQSVTIRVRIDGVDTPELRGACAAERAKAEAAKLYLERRLGHAEIVLTAVRHDKYGGRVRANVRDAKGDLAPALIAAGLARAYAGERRKTWCGTT